MLCDKCGGNDWEEVSVQTFFNGDVQAILLKCNICGYEDDIVT